MVNTASRWSAADYAKNAAFVPRLGDAVLQLLNPQPGELILDLGCGDGALTGKIVEAGARVRLDALQRLRFRLDLDLGAGPDDPGRCGGSHPGIHRATAPLRRSEAAAAERVSIVVNSSLLELVFMATSLAMTRRSTSRASDWFIVCIPSFSCPVCIDE